MKHFNIKRFGRTLLWTMQTSRKEWTRTMLTLSVVFLGFPLLSMLFNIGSGSAGVVLRLRSMFPICLSMYLFFTLFAGCWVMSNMKTKGERISFKMLPATDLEKFLARIIYVTAGLVIGATVAFLLADALRMLLCLAIFHDTVYSMAPDFIKAITPSLSGDSVSKNSQLLFGSISLLLWCHSFSVLGGTVFRKHPAICTAFAYVALAILFGVAVSNPDINTYMFSIDISEPDSESVGKWLLWVLGAVELLVAAFNYWLAFTFFRRSQAINNKFWNV